MSTMRRFVDGTLDVARSITTSPIIRSQRVHRLTFRPNSNWRGLWEDCLTKDEILVENIASYSTVRKACKHFQELSKMFHALSLFDEWLKWLIICYIAHIVRNKSIFLRLFTEVFLIFGWSIFLQKTVFSTPFHTCLARATWKSISNIAEGKLYIRPRRLFDQYVAMTK